MEVYLNDFCSKNEKPKHVLVHTRL